MLTGTLDDFTLPDVLRLIAAARRTGGLAVTRDGGAGSLYFRDGTVSRAAPRYDRRSEPASAARAIEDLAFDLMRWERGEFTWTPEPAPPAHADAAVDVDELLHAVTRRLEELAEIQTLVPSEEAVLTMAPQPPEGAVQINISPAEWRVLVLVDGHRTVSEIAGATHLDDLEAMRLLYGLAAAGLVTAGGRATPSPRTVSETADTSDTTAGSPAAPEVAQPVHAAPEPTEPVGAPAPEPVEELAAAAAEDGFFSELAMEPASAFDALPAAPADDPAVDRSTAARELSGLFDDVDPTQVLGGMRLAAPPGPPSVPRRVEDDDQVTRGLISRLIDGVKGL